MKYQVTHQTEYVYSEPVSTCYNQARLVPRHTFYQNLISNEVNVWPQPLDYETRTDHFGNKVSSFSLTQQHKRLKVVSTSIIQLSVPDYSIGLFGPVTWEQALDKMQGIEPDTLDARQYLLNSPFIQISDAIREYAILSFPPGKYLFDASLDLMRRINKEFKFVPGFTTISTPLSEVFLQRKGVCQDFAHFAIACIRSMGLAARYMSGYIETLPPAGKEKLVGADASHAWIAVFIPGTGWVNFDPTNNLIPSTQHITLAWGRDYSDVSPLRGVIYTGGTHKLSVSVDVRRI